jgi:polyketide synthase PksN
LWRTAIGGRGAAGAAEAREEGQHLEGADEFDADFFGLAPHAAAQLGPQERLLLETVWQTLEHAGHLGARLDALTAADGEPRAVGVYVAHGPYDHVPPAAERSDGPPPGARPGCRGVLPGRLSALLDLRGPSQCVDSGQSSVLAALHLALGALRGDECAAALVAAVDVRPHNDRSDEDTADDGVGAVLIRPLAAAQAAGDTVHAVIRASAVAHAGRAAPSDADARLARRARAAAGLDAADIDLYESPAGAGDSGAATGVTALTRAVLQLTHGTLLPVPGGPDAAAWPRPRDPRGRELPRRAAVAVRGEGGTAAHVILEEYLGRGTEARDPAEPERAELILMSAPTPRHLAATAWLLADRLTGDAAAPPHLAALARELRIGRATMDCRLAVTAHRTEELADALREFADAPADRTGGAGGARVVHADLRGRRDAVPLVEELDETAGYLTALWQGQRLDALSRLWLAGVDVTRGDDGAHRARPRLALPGTAMLRRPVGTGLPASGGAAR